MSSCRRTYYGIIALLFFAGLLICDEVFSYEKIGWPKVNNVSDSYYFVKFFYNTNRLDKDLRYRREIILIKVNVIKNTDNTGWYNKTIATLIENGKTAGWKLEDYRFFYKNELRQAHLSHDAHREEVLRSILTGLNNKEMKNGKLRLSDGRISEYIKSRMVKIGSAASPITYSNNITGNHIDKTLDTLQSCLPVNSNVEPDVAINVQERDELDTLLILGGKEKGVYYRRGMEEKHFKDLFRMIDRRLGNDGYVFQNPNY